MDVLTVSQLMHLTRNELCDLYEQIEQMLVAFEAGSVARTNALTSLTSIRRVMVLRGLLA